MVHEAETLDRLLRLADPADAFRTLDSRATAERVHTELNGETELAAAGLG